MQWDICRLVIVLALGGGSEFTASAAPFSLAPGDIIGAAVTPHGVVLERMDPTTGLVDSLLPVSNLGGVESFFDSSFFAITPWRSLLFVGRSPRSRTPEFFEYRTESETLSRFSLFAESIANPNPASGFVVPSKVYPNLTRPVVAFEPDGHLIYTTDGGEIGRLDLRSRIPTRASATFVGNDVKHAAILPSGRAVFASASTQTTFEVDLGYGTDRVLPFFTSSNLMPYSDNEFATWWGSGRSPGVFNIDTGQSTSFTPRVGYFASHTWSALSPDGSWWALSNGQMHQFNPLRADPTSVPLYATWLRLEIVPTVSVPEPPGFALELCVAAFLVLRRR